MDKLKTVGFIILAVLFCYIILVAAWPVMTEVIETSSNVVGANPNLSDYVGAKEGLDIMPWVLYFVPAIVGLIAIVIVMKREG